MGAIDINEDNDKNNKGDITSTTKIGFEPTYNMKLAFSTFGIMGFFVFYGILQEKIMGQPYKDEEGTEEYFTDTTFLVLSNRLFAAFIAICIVLKNGESLKNVAPLHKYFSVAFSNFCATWCQYEALKYVNFPTQTLGKCGKMLPVMIVGTLISKKRYSLKDYSIAISITTGCMIFFMTGNIKSHEDESEDTSNSVLYGMILMALYMFFDSFTSTFQEKLFKTYKMSTQDQMIYVNSWSAIISILILILNGRLLPSIEFINSHDGVLYDSSMLSVCASLGQMVIYFTIKEFGALVLSTIMVTRQVISIVISTFLYKHDLTKSQWFGASLVFGTLYYKTSEDSKKRSSHNTTTTTANNNNTTSSSTESNTQNNNSDKV